MPFTPFHCYLRKTFDGYGNTLISSDTPHDGPGTRHGGHGPGQAHVRPPASGRRYRRRSRLPRLRQRGDDGPKDPARLLQGACRGARRNIDHTLRQAGSRAICVFRARGKVNLADRKKRAEARAQRQKDLNAKWAASLATHNTLDEKWASYEESLDSILANPLMRNLEDPAVAAAVRAMGRAQSLRSASAPHLGLDETIASSGASDYLDAVNEYQTALEAAQRKSELRGLDEFSKSDQDKIERARRLLALAMDPGATESERQTAYERVIKIVKGLRLSVPKKAFSRVELTSGVTSRGMLEAGV